MRRVVVALGSAALTLFGAAAAVFAIFQFAPGDRARVVAEARFGGEGTADAGVIEAVRAELGLDVGPLAAFASWLADVATLDFGRSFVSGEPAIAVLVSGLAYTVPLALAALLFGLATAVPLAVLAALRPGGVLDRLAVAVASIGVAMPAFWLGLLLILLFAATLRWAPAYGAGSPAHLVLPAITIGVWVTASLTRLLRSLLREALAAPHLDALRLRGVSEAEILARHVAPAALGPFCAMVTLEFALLLDGALIVETVFARNGVGAVLVQAVLSRDTPVIQAVVLFVAATYVVANAAADAGRRALDPRLRDHG